MARIRADKYLADMGVGTRSEVKGYIKSGRVTVNDTVIIAADVKIDTDTDTVCFDGTPVSYAEYEYFMLNKPAGVVSATEDARDTTVLDLITAKNRRDLFPVGRLDKDTQGLLLITNDGELAHELLSPKKHVDKLYYAHIDGVVTQKHVDAFQDGLFVDETFRALPAHLTILNVDETTCQSEIELTIREGKFHQVKRMFEACDMHVTFLKRLRMGALVLDTALKPGEYRELTKDEIGMLKECCH